jgi:hypothetical protein
MVKDRSGGNGLAAALVASSLFAGCVDPLVNRPTGEAERWTGRADAVETAGPRCGPIEFELFRDGPSIGGRAREPEAPEAGLAAIGGWWVEGTVNPNGSFLFTLRRQGPHWREGPRPASVWRGRFGASEVVAVEQPPSCGRQVRLVREAGGAPAS